MYYRPTASNSNLKCDERKKLRKQQVEMYLNEPAGEGNTLIDPLPSKTVTTEQRVQNMSNKIDVILKCLSPPSTT